jgi:ubiquinone/menaquinone biosynthesis C-methylase UbiE
MNNRPSERTIAVDERNGPPAEFDGLAKDYDTLLDHPLRNVFAGSSDFFHRRKLDLIAGYLAGSGRESLKMAWLDVGCGRGELLALGAAHFRTAVGCDPSQEMLRCGRGRILWQPDPSKLPFEDSTFDLVTAVCVLHHVERGYETQLMRELLRVLRPGGLVCVIEHNPFNPITRWIVSRTPVDRDAHLMSAGHVKARLRAVGFQAPETKYFLYLPSRWYTSYGRMERFLENAPAGGQYAVFAPKAGKER